MRHIILAVAAVSLLLAGCATTRPPYSADLQSKLGEVSKRVYVTSATERALPDGTLKVAVFVDSETKFDQEVTYRVRWFDASGMPMNTTVSAPVKRLLSKKSSFDFTAVAPGPKAKSYKIDILTEGE